MLFQHDTPINRLLNLAMMNGVGKLVEETVTGNPVSFETDVAKPLKGLLIPFTPVQSGTGDPSPSNVRPITGWTGLNINRTGKNLYDGQFPSLSANIYYRHYFVGDSIVTGSSNVPLSSQGYGNIFLLPGKVSTGVSTGGNNITDGVSRTVTPVDGWVTIAYRNNYDVDPSDYEVQIEVGATATTYEPYSGTTVPVVFPALGRNLLPNKTASRSGTSIYIGTDKTDEFPIRFVAGKKYTLSYTQDGSGTPQAYFNKSDAPNTGVSFGNGSPCTFTATETADVRIYIYNPNAMTSVTNFMLEEGETAHSYEPYTTTAYGGELDALTGVLTVTHKFIDLTNVDWLWVKSSSYSGGFYASIPTNNIGIKTQTDFICSHAKIAHILSEYEYGTCYCDGSVNIRIMQSGSELSDWETYRAEQSQNGTPVCICGELATPYTVQLDPVTLSTLIGTNTLWTDTNGSNEITYMKKG